MKEKVDPQREDAIRSVHIGGPRNVALEAGGKRYIQFAAPNGENVMGEVRVTVRLTNAVDEALVRRGLLAAEKVRAYEADAHVDTGAVKSILPVQVVQQLGLAIVGKTRARYANDSGEDVDITEMVGIEINGRRTTEEALVLGSGVLIGQTVLESLDLLVDCVSHRLVPNPEHPDQPVINVR